MAAQAFAQAERVLRTVSDASSRAELWLATARALRQAGRNRDAERALRFAQQAASNPYRLRQIAETQVEWELYDAAVESARRIPARALVDACAKTRIILLLAQRRQWSDALALAEPVSDLDWRGAVLINLALEAARQGDRLRAQRVLERIPSAVLRFWGYWATLPNTLSEAQAHLQAMEQALQAIEP
ncbi:MAG: hypothetical protein NZ704_15330, partial [Geminicoccaceae bacterium]|nr:hypothetical protein [Geminicoccaceae bacterium]